MSLFLSIASTDDELCLIHVGNTFIFNDDDDDDDVDDGGEDDIDNDDDDVSDTDDKQEEENLPLMFYMFAKAQVESGEHISLDKALNALKHAESSLLLVNETLKTLKEKALKRPLDDKKVPPGSSLVKRSLSDDR